MKSGFITHAGKEIFCGRYENLNMETFTVELQEAERLIATHPEDSLLVVVNFTGTIISPGIIDQMTKSTLKYKKLFHRTAIFGIEGARQKILDLVVKATGLPVKSFQTEKDALDWLVS